MKRYYIFKGIKIALLVAIGIAALGGVVMLLWNWLMPSIFGLREICFAESLGLLVLSKILFGGMKGGHGGKCCGNQCHSGGRHQYWKEKMHRKMEGMSEEEREKFKKKLSRCGYNPDQENKSE